MFDEIKSILTGLGLIGAVAGMCALGGWLLLLFGHIVWPYMLAVVVIGAAWNVGHEFRRR